jgi:hypothetical protein
VIGFEGVTGASLFSITFRMDRPGELDSFGEIGEVGIAQFVFARVSAGSDVLFQTQGNDFFDFDATLLPGTYTFEVDGETFAIDGAFGFQSVSLHVREVPEPVSGLLLGMGLAGIASRRRRRRVRSR